MPKSQKLFASLRLKSANDFNAYMDRLGSVRLSVRKPHTAHGALLNPSAMLPSHVFIHLCEWATVKEDDDVSGSQLKQLVRNPPQDVASKLERCVNSLDKEYELMGEGAGRQGSFSIEVVKYLLDLDSKVLNDNRKVRT